MIRVKFYEDNSQPKEKIQATPQFNQKRRHVGPSKVCFFPKRQKRTSKHVTLRTHRADFYQFQFV